MKKLTYALILTILMPLCLQAQYPAEQKTSAADFNMFGKTPGPVDFREGKTKPAETQAYTQIETVDDAVFSYYFLSTPFVYEPISNTLALLHQTASIVQNQPPRSIVSVLLSTNNGVNWAKRQLIDTINIIPCNGSLGVLNINQSTSLADLSFMTLSRIAKPEGTQYPWWGGFYLAATGSIIEAYEFKSPTNGQKWNISLAATFNDVDKGYVCNAGMLYPEEYRQYGHYGFSMVEMYEDGLNDLIMTSPAQWGLDRFIPAMGIYSTYNSIIALDFDEEGTLYAAVNNVLVSDPELSHRSPVISKSDDFGENWSEFSDPMPYSMIENLVFQESGAVDYAPSPFYSAGFVVTGVNEFSYIYRIFHTLDDSQRFFTRSMLVEAFKKDGTWGIRKISDMSRGIVFTIQNKVANPFEDTLRFNSRRSEVQAATTADGQYLLVKWIDYTNREIAIIPPFRHGQGYTLDTMNTTDVFSSYRSVNDETWSPALNVTNDELYNKVTYIPRIIPDLQHVPLISLQTVLETNPQRPRSAYSPWVQQMIIDQLQGQNILFTSYDATGEVSVEEKEDPGSEAILHDIYPNPVTGFAEINFTLGKALHTKIEIHNTLGQLVDVVQEGFLPAGFHAVNLNTKKYSSGIYYYTLTVGEKTMTKILSVSD